MSDIDKMYENAGVKKQYYYFDSADGNIYTWELNENGNDKHNMCFIGKPKIKDREFTAEKQLELIKWLIQNKRLCIHKAEYSDNFYMDTLTTRLNGVDNSSFEECLASMLNLIWQDLTPEEKQQVKGILE